VYDTHLKRQASFKMPSDDFIYKNTRKLDLKFKKYRGRVLNELASVTGLQWREKHIYVYITAGVGWFSMPLTMSIHEKTDALLDTLIHELVHRILSENENWLLIKKRWFDLMRKYKQEKMETRTHIPIHAIHKHIFLKFFSRSHLNKEIKRMGQYKNYARSWEIVENDGFEDIIRSLNPKYKGLKKAR
jgi:hypothetical protein